MILGCEPFFVSDGDISSPQYSTWICTINSDGTELHYLYEGNGDVRFNSDGSKIIIGLRNYGFKIIDAEIGTVLVDIDTLSTLSHYTLSNDNAICFSASSDLTSSKDLFIYEPITSLITNITMTDSIHENAPSYNNDCNKVVYILFDSLGSSAVLKVYDFTSQQFLTLATENLGFRYPQFSIDESQIIFSNYHSYNLYDFDEQINIETFEGNTENYPASIYEDKMTFSASGQILNMNIDGSELMNLGDGFHPQFSPDGSKIAYGANDGLYITNSGGTDKQKLTDEFGDYPHFSPDGSKIVFLMDKYE